MAVKRSRNASNGRSGDAAPAGTPTVDAAIAALMAGAADRAATLCAAILARWPDHADAHHVLGVIAHGAGNHGEALRRFDRAIAAAPRVAAYHNNRSLALRALRRPAEAEAACRTALALDPDFREARVNCGHALVDLGRGAEAEALFRAALAARAGFADAEAGLGNALMLQGRAEEAVAAYRAAVALRPDFAEGWNNLGSALQTLGRPEEAEPALRAAIAADPRYAPAHANLAHTLLDQGQRAQAALSCLKALTLDPGNPVARWNLAMVQLVTGDYAHGWEGYEARLVKPDTAAAYPAIPRPLWDGSPKHGGTLLLWAEQGLGDSLQFARFVPEAAARFGGRVVFACQPPLVSLMAGSLPAGSATVVATGAPPPDCDCWLPLMGLGALFAPAPDRIAGRVPYLAAGDDAAAEWRRRWGGKPAIGLAWAGNARHANDRNRSLPVSLLAPLAARSDVHFVSLQVGARAGDAAAVGLAGRIADVSAELGDFSDTASLMAALDLVITVDTSVAHLAGALGRPVWTLLPAVPDWRWLLERGDSPWYPTMRLFRQPARGDWAAVIEAVEAALDRFLGAQ